MNGTTPVKLANVLGRAAQNVVRQSESSGSRQNILPKAKRQRGSPFQSEAVWGHDGGTNLTVQYNPPSSSRSASTAALRSGHGPSTFFEQPVEDQQQPLRASPSGGSLTHQRSASRFVMPSSDGEFVDGPVAPTPLALSPDAAAHSVALVNTADGQLFGGTKLAHQMGTSMLHEQRNVPTKIGPPKSADATTAGCSVPLPGTRVPISPHPNVVVNDFYTARHHSEQEEQQYFTGTDENSPALLQHYEQQHPRRRSPPQEESGVVDAAGCIKPPVHQEEVEEEVWQHQASMDVQQFEFAEGAGSLQQETTTDAQNPDGQQQPGWNNNSPIGRGVRFDIDVPPGGQRGEFREPSEASMPMISPPRGSPVWGRTPILPAR